MMKKEELTNAILEMETVLSALKSFREKFAAPDSYAYRYADGIRFNHGQSVNGSKPTHVIPVYFGAEKAI